MKFKGIITMCLAGMALTANAQTHIEGEEYYKADQLENAKDLLLRSLQNPQTNKSVSDYYLGLISLEENKNQDAQKYFNEGVQANPEYAYNYVGLGRVQLLNGDVKGAQASFKEAEKHAKKDASLYIAIARAYDAADASAYEKEITKYLEKARKTDMANADIYIFEGDRLREVKDWGGAAGKYDMAVGYDNTATPAYVKYANLFTQVNPQYAIDMLNKLLEINPNSALGQRELANAYYNKKDYANAASAYEKYVNNKSHFKNDEDRYAFLLFYGQRYKDGYDYASKLLKENPSNFTAQRYQFMNAAQLKEMKDQLLPMAEALYAAHKKDPAKNKFAAIDYILISGELQDAKRGEEAIEVLKEAVTEMPDNANMHKQLAMAFIDVNNMSAAADAYKNYIAKSEEPGYNDFVQQAIFDFYAGIENQEKDADAATKYFGDSASYADKAAAILPDNYKPIMIKGDIAKQTAAKDKASSAAQPLYEQAIVLLENSADPSKYARDAKTLYNYLGNYYLDQKNVAKAKEYFNKYLQYDPDNADYRKFVEGLK